MRLENFDMHPGYVGLRVLRGEWRGVELEWTDPDGNKQTDTQKVRRVVNDHPLEYFNDKDRLSVGQYMAGVRYRRAYEIYSGFVGMSIDLTHGGLLVAVQTSGRREPLNEAQTDAAQIIKTVVKTLGYRRNYHFQLITGEGRFPREVARKDGAKGNSAITRVMTQWLDDLDTVARAFGLVR